MKGTTLIKAIAFLPSRLPLRAQYGLADLLAFFAHRVLRYRLSTVRKNLALCFPEMDAQQLRRTEREFYRHFGEIAVEALWFGGCRGHARFNRSGLIEVGSYGELARLQQTAPSVVVLAGHTGNWEILAGLLAAKASDGGPAVLDLDTYRFVYKKLSSPAWNQFMRENRLALIPDSPHFEGYLESTEFLRYILTHREEHKFYTVISDQRPYRYAKGTVGVRFFGQECRSMAAVAGIACRLHLAVVYQHMEKVRRGKYTVSFETICDDAATMDEAEIMQRYYDCLESDIRKQPECYLWSHRRFLGAK